MRALKAKTPREAVFSAVTTPAHPLRILTAVPLCDGHDSAITTINIELVRAGIEVIYLGYNRSARDIARAAIQEDVQAIGISSYNGGHVEFFGRVAELLKSESAGGIGLFGGGGGTISAADAKNMLRHGVDRIFFPGTTLEAIVTFVLGTYRNETKVRSHHGSTDYKLARELTIAELSSEVSNDSKANRNGKHRQGQVDESTSLARSVPRVVGITGPGGAGKTTLIDELVLRALRADTNSRIAILSHDPSIISRGALLGDRAAMIYAQDDRVFMRSLGTRGQAGGVSAATRRCLQILKNSRDVRGRPTFHLIFLETVGIGQEAIPFAPGEVDQTVLVMSPDYGSRLQLQKIAMLDAADAVVVNKADLGGATTARAEIASRLKRNGLQQKLVAAIAKKHRDSGVDELFELIKSS